MADDHTNAAILNSLNDINRQLGHVQKDLGKLNATAARQEGQIETLSARITHVEDKVNDMHRTLFQTSNGKPAVVERLAALETAEEATKESARRDFTMRVGILLSLLTGGLSLIIAIVTRH